MPEKKAASPQSEMPTESIEYYLYEDLALPLAIVFAICAVAFILAMVKRTTLPKWRLLAFPAGGFCVLYLAAYSFYEIVLPPKPQRDLAMFEELCRTYAKDTINKTVNGVEAVVQLTYYPEESWEWLHARGKQLQYGVTDPFGRNGAIFPDKRNGPIYAPYEFSELKVLPSSPEKEGFQNFSLIGNSYWRRYIAGTPGKYEEAISREEYFRQLASYFEFLRKARDDRLKTNQPFDGKLPDEPQIKGRELRKSASPNPKAAYGYLSEDISTKEMRFRWIAGGRIKILSIKTGEILAERTGFFFGQASNGKYPTWSHSPWTRSCPKDSDTFWFVLSVLKAAKGE